MTAISEKLDEQCPLRSVRMLSKDPPYMSPLLKLLLQKNHKQKSARGTHKLKETERRIHDTLIANSKGSNNKAGSASWWMRTNYMLEKGKRCSTVLDFDVEEMNQNFADICKDEDYQPPRKAETRGMPPLEISTHFVYGVLRKTRDTALGKDGIPAWVFPENAHNFTFTLKRIIDHCFAQGKLPAGQKIPKVLPLPKVATPGNLIDLRPIAITPIIARVLEIILIKSFVTTNYEEKIEARQHGFRVGASTVSALTWLQNNCRHSNHWDLTMFASSPWTFQNHSTK